MDFTISLPQWAIDEMNQLPQFMPSLEERMAAVIRFSQLNFENDTGGPFAAGVFERETGKVVMIGVNRVVPSNCSSAHAEVVTLSLAQKRLGTFDLGGPGLPTHQLVVNWRPCAMCYGAVIWSGIRSLVIAGSGEELEELTGFDEGPIHPEWEEELMRRGIDVTNNLLREEACKVFRAFGESDRLVYNGRLGV
ncbi:MAG: nucleoside deaminase [Chloroflexota bacterium]